MTQFHSCTGGTGAPAEPPKSNVIDFVAERFKREGLKLRPHPPEPRHRLDLGVTMQKLPEGVALVVLMDPDGARSLSGTIMTSHQALDLARRLVGFAAQAEAHMKANGVQIHSGRRVPDRSAAHRRVNASSRLPGVLSHRMAARSAQGSCQTTRDLPAR